MLKALLTAIEICNSLFRLRRTYEPQLKDLILQTSDVEFKPTYHVCEYIGGPNLALKQPTFCKEETTDYQNCKLEWVNMAIRVVEVSKLEQFLPKNQH